jgi:dCMP deaminase
MKPRLLQAYMKTAETFAELSHARRLHVGAIVVKDDRIISIGYNGMPAGWENDCEYKEYPDRYDKHAEWADLQFPLQEPDGTYYRLKTRPEVLHAESNAISKLARSSESGDGATMFITHAPCMDCSKLIYQSGIRRVYFGSAYRDDAGVQFLKSCGIEVEQLERGPDGKAADC